MNWLLLIFSVIKPFFSSTNDNKMGNPIAEFKEMIKENAMKVVGLFAAASALASIFQTKKLEKKRKNVKH